MTKFDDINLITIYKNRGFVSDDLALRKYLRYYLMYSLCISNKSMCVLCVSKEAIYLLNEEYQIGIPLFRSPGEIF